ncbi:hypothetical protein XI02_22395 [Bradyrhizobium sp. CCBAU 21365]|nr:hypothetical protein XI02_22395 [Bradyrhizobium sp. CCBAU 21365]
MKEQPWHRRHAVQLACQLPEDQEDALLIIRATERLIDFVAEPRLRPAPPISAVVHLIEPRDRA